MTVEFDPVKDAANQAKHGVSLAMAGDLDWEAALVWTQKSAPHSSTFGPIEDRRAVRLTISLIVATLKL